MNATNLGRCGTCAMPLRPGRATLAQFPNTRQFKRAGICTVCHAQALLAPRPTFDLDHAALTLTLWLQGRRRRGVPADGIDIGC